MTAIDLASVRSELDACPLTDRAREAVDGLLAEVEQLRSAQPAETPEGLVRLTVNLIPAAVAAMKSAAEATGFGRTDTVNRALITYGETAGAHVSLTVAVNDPRRGKCPTCGKSIALKKDGTLREHVNPNSKRHGWSQRCAGSGSAPVAKAAATP